LPDVSFGTHFFQDLVESSIFYLPLYPDDPEVLWNEAFFDDAENSLGLVLPQYADMEGVVRVIHVPEAAAGRLLHVVRDGEEERARGWVR
jgi:pyruvate,water dikinase